MGNGLMLNCSKILFIFSLNEALKYSKTNDGPTNNLLNFMKKYDYLVPETWKYYRPLTEKWYNLPILPYPLTIKKIEDK